ncbi:MAG: UDP-N-acetylmuramate--alanine ligase, partial [Lentisphaerae bacterium]
MTGLGDLLADKRSVFYFCGIGGVGMRALAMLLRHRGFQVRGSDRVFDQGSESELRRRFEEGGIRIVPQNGEGITSEISALITSTAVEKQIPDVCRALELGLPVFHRSELLSEIFAAGPAVAVTGTSGKSTVTAMIGHILDIHGFSPTVINGADILNSPRHSQALFPNLWAGDPSCCVIEADESDGSCRRYFPRVCVITTMSRDHMSIDELEDVFAQVTAQTQEVVVTNPAVAESVREALSEDTSLEMVSQREMGQGRWTFRCLQSDEAGERAQIIVDGEPVEEPLLLQLPGEHNIYDSLLAIAASSIFGIQPSEAVRALASFRGLGRRLEVVGELKEYGIRVIDDFAHNPEKIQASLSTLRKRHPRLLIFFQLHGYGPTRF